VISRTTYPVGAGDNYDLKNSIIDSVKTLDGTKRIPCFLFKKRKRLWSVIHLISKIPLLMLEQTTLSWTYHTNLPQRTNVSLHFLIFSYVSIQMYIIHRLQLYRVYMTTTELVWAWNGRRFTEGGGDLACTPEGTFERLNANYPTSKW